MENDELKRVVSALKTVRSEFPNTSENDIYSAIAQALKENNIVFYREARLVGTRMRIDFVTSERVGIEVKRERPNPKTVSRQLAKYAATDSLSAIVLVSERAPSPGWDVGVSIPHACVSLASLYGVAV